jgi:hypothetical protein
MYGLTGELFLSASIPSCDKGMVSREKAVTGDPPINKERKKIMQTF